MLFEYMADKRTGRTYKSWLSSLSHFRNYIQSIPIGGFEDTIRGFEDYLTKQKIGQNSMHLYWTKFKCVCNQAFEDGILPPMKIHNLQTVKTHRSYLTLSELKTLSETHCENQQIKRMALFSALTGMRFSDISKLTTSMLLKTESGYQVVFTQQKTGGVEYLPISEQAFRILETEKTGDRIFPIGYSNYVNQVIRKWLLKAGIDRKISFHCFRHSMAVMHLESGTDIYTLSKLLGHTNVKTTEIYANISDRKKVEAINRISI
jgi:integrase